MQRLFWLPAALALALPGLAVAEEVLKVDQLIERRFSAPTSGGNPADCYRMDLAEGREVVVKVAAGGLKPAVVWRAGGCAGAVISQRTAKTDVATLMVLARSGPTFLTVESTDGRPGAYAMRVSARPALLTQGQAVEGRFDVGVVCYRVNSTALWMVAQLKGDADARLAIFDNGNCAGTPVASDNDDVAGGGTDARAVYRQITMQDHSVQVSRWGFAPGRGYSLVYRTMMSPPADAPPK